MATKPVHTQTATARAAKKVANNSDTQRAEAERIAAASYMFNGYAPDSVPSNTRLLISAVGQLIGFGLSFYWGVQAVGWLMAATLAATSSTVIAVCLMFVGAALAFHAAWRTGRVVEEVVLNWRFESVADIGRDIRIGAAKKLSLVRGWFTPTDRIEVEAAR